MSIIRKSRGNWFWRGDKNALMPSRHTLAELGLDHPDVNAFHLDPETFEPFDPDQEKVKHALDGLVDELAKEIMHAGITSDEGKAKIQARRDLNEATKRFNKMKREHMGDEEYLAHKLPLPYPNVATGELNSEYTKMTYSPEFERHAKWEGHGKYNDMKHPVTREQLNEGMSLTHPSQRRTRDENGTLLNVSESSKRIDPHGYLTELWHLHQLNQLRDVIHERGYHVPERALMGGGINSHVFSPYRRHTMTESLGAGHAPVDPDDKLHRGEDGMGFGMLRAIATLHPDFFKERGSQTVADERLPWLEQYFPHVATNILSRLARTPVGEILTEEFRVGEKPGRSARSPFNQVLNGLKRNLGLPSKQDAKLSGRDSDAYRAYAAFNSNAEHLLLIMGANHEDKNRFRYARSPLSKALYASIQARRKGPVGASSVQNSFIRSFPRITPIGGGEVQDIDYHHGMEPNFRDPPVAEVPKTSFAGPRGGTPLGSDGTGFDFAPNTRGPAGLEARTSRLEGLTPRREPPTDMVRLSEPMGTVITLMESMQRADARMDNAVLKSLPGRRQFDLGKVGDKEELCKAFNLSEVDLYYIQQARGDWVKLAEHLNVDPLVVKSVKVALG